MTIANLAAGLLFFAGSLGILRLSRDSLGSSLTPIGIFGAVWLVLFGAYAMRWVYYVPVDLSTWLLLAGGCCSLMAGATVVAVGSARRWPEAMMRRPTTAPDWSEMIDKGKYEKAVFVLFVLGMLGFFVYVRTVASLYGMGAFLEAQSDIRIGQSSDEFRRSFGSEDYMLVHLNILVAVLTMGYISIFPKQERKRLIVAIGIMALVSTLFMAQRTHFFAAVLLSLFLGLYLKPVQRAGTRMYLRALLLIGVLLLVFNLIAQMLDKTAYRDPLRVVYLPPFLSFLVSPYIYLTGTIPTFQAFIRHIHEFTLGANTLLPLTKIVAIVAEGIVVPEEVTPYYNIPFLFNATTFLSVYYRDWGVFGVLIAPYLIGAAAMATYVRMRRAPSFWLAFFNMLFAYCLAYSVFNNRFITTYVWQFAVMGYFFARLVTKRRSRPVGVETRFSGSRSTYPKAPLPKWQHQGGIYE